MDRARIQLCGRLLIRINGERIEDRLPGRQGRLLFAYLAAKPDRAATRDELIDALWPRGLPAEPELALSALLSKLRRLLGDDGLAGRTEVRLILPAETMIDIVFARDGLHKAESMIAAARWLDAYGPSVSSIGIAERPFLRGEQAPWIDRMRAEQEDVLTRGLECLVQIQLAVGSHELPVAAQLAKRLIELAPYRESGYCLLMRALQREGNTAEALRVYEQLRERLRDELGASPSREAQDLHRELLSGN